MQIFDGIYHYLPGKMVMGYVSFREGNCFQKQMFWIDVNRDFSGGSHQFQPLSSLPYQQKNCQAFEKPLTCSNRSSTNECM